MYSSLFTENGRNLQIIHALDQCLYSLFLNWLIVVKSGCEECEDNEGWFNVSESAGAGPPRLPQIKGQ